MSRVVRFKRLGRIKSGAELVLLRVDGTDPATVAEEVALHVARRLGIAGRVEVHADDTQVLVLDRGALVGVGDIEAVTEPCS